MGKAWERPVIMSIGLNIVQVDGDKRVIIDESGVLDENGGSHVGK